MTETAEPDKREQRIAELEADLARAYQVINQLHKQTTQLQAQVAELQNNHKQQSTLLVKNTSVFPFKKPHHSIKQSTVIHEDTDVTHSASRLTRKRRSTKLSQLQFVSIATLVAVVMTLIGLAVTRRQNSRITQPDTKPSVVLPKLPNSPPSTSPVSPTLPQAESPSSLLPQIRQEKLELAYNIKTPPNLNKSPKLQGIVNNLVNIAAEQGLPRQPLSITLIDIKTSEYAEFQQYQLRYPASIAKMFWMVYAYAQIENEKLDEATIQTYLNDMIKKSDNDSTSEVIDLVTNTRYSESVEGKAYKDWLDKRKKINLFFEEAGYKNINVSQKVFPIPKLKLTEPKGRDLQMRGNDPNAPIRNKITTEHAARLLYEIYRDMQAVSPSANQKMADLLTVDTETRKVNKDKKSLDRFNPVYGFLSQDLPENVYFGAKAGWTSGSRQEAAYIATPDGKAAYILVIFGDDRAYAYNWEIFPKLSRIVFERMTK